MKSIYHANDWYGHKPLIHIIWVQLLKAHAEAKEKGITNTVASCTLVAAVRIKDQHLVEGNERNGLKLTRPQDVDLFKALIHTEKEPWMK